MDPTIARITDAVMGAAPAPAAQPGPAVPPTQAEAQPPAPQETKTATEKAIEATAPKDEGNRQSDEAVLYEVDFGGQKRKLTPQQIASTFDRYGKLNHENAQMKPILEVARALMEKTGSDPMTLARGMIALAQGDAPATMGGQAASAPTPAPMSAPGRTPPSGDADPLASWEQENAASLPPGYRDILTAVQNLPQALAQIQAALGQTQGAAAGQADAVRQGAMDARQREVNAIRQTIANNLNGAAQRLGLGEDAAQDFQVFAAERGYTMEDFSDPRMTLQVMQDFKNARMSPEMERLKEMAQRRQAWAGSIGSTPGAGAAAPEPAQPSPFDRLLGSVMQQRGMG